MKYILAIALIALLSYLSGFLGFSRSDVLLGMAMGYLLATILEGQK